MHDEYHRAKQSHIKKEQLDLEIKKTATKEKVKKVMALKLQREVQ